MKDKKYPTWVKTNYKRIFRSEEEWEDGTPDYVLSWEGNKRWRLKMRTSERPEYFESKREALEWAGGTLTVKNPDESGEWA